MSSNVKVNYYLKIQFIEKYHIYILKLYKYKDSILPQNQYLSSLESSIVNKSVLWNKFQIAYLWSSI